MRYINLFLLHLVLSLVVLTIAPEVSAQTPDSPDENCAISLNGQDFHTSGGEYGIQKAERLPYDFIKDAIQPRFGEDLMRLLSSSESGQDLERVAIIIVDNFQGKAISEIDLTVPNPSFDELSHGKLVDYHITQLLDTTESLSPGSTSNISIAHVDISDGNGNYTTHSLTNRLMDKLFELLETDIPIDRVIINMSFTILPCHIVDDVYSRGISLTNYYSSVALAGDQSIRTFSNWLKDLLFQTEVNYLSNGGEGLNGLVSRPVTYISSELEHVVFVASAGNYGEETPYTFFPGAWPEVISVSGQEYTRSGYIRWIHSNLGEVIAPAAWYNFGDGFEYAGTSFSAPYISVIAAHYLSQYKVSCPFDAVTNDGAKRVNASRIPIYAFDQTFVTIAEGICP